MGDAVLFEKGGERRELAAQALERSAVAGVAVEPDAERVALRPVHLDDRIPAAADRDPVREIIEADEIGAFQRADRPRDRRVFVLGSRDLAMEAAHRQPTPGRCHHVGQREAAGQRHRQAERIDLDLAPAEFRVTEGGRRVLHRLVVFDDLRVRGQHDGSPPAGSPTSANKRAASCRPGACGRRRALPRRSGRRRAASQSRAVGRSAMAPHRAATGSSSRGVGDA